MKEKINFSDLPSEDQRVIKEFLKSDEDRYPKDLSEESIEYLDKFLGKTGKRKAGFKPIFSEMDIIVCLKKETEPIKTATLLKRLEGLDPKYGKVTKGGLSKFLNKMGGIVEKVKREDDIADYWKLAES